MELPEDENELEESDQEDLSTAETPNKLYPRPPSAETPSPMPSAGIPYEDTSPMSLTSGASPTLRISHEGPPPRMMLPASPSAEGRSRQRVRSGSPSKSLGIDPSGKPINKTRSRSTSPEKRTLIKRVSSVFKTRSKGRTK